jgi:hypothetical protein
VTGRRYTLNHCAQRALQCLISGAAHMTLPPLYKYLDIEGAKLTLQNGNFKHAKPSDFNDLEDLTIRSIFPESDEAALQEIKNNFTDVLLDNLDKAATCINLQMRQQITLIQEAYRKNPDVAKVIKEITKNDAVSELYDLGRLRERSKGFVAEINNFMQDFRVLCVSQENNSKKMWELYAQDSHGIVLRILPNVDKDSKFQLFRKVEYCASRPPLYKSALEFLANSLFGDQEKRAREIIEDIVHSKTLKWEYEDEYRLAIPIRRGEDWNKLPYHSEEIPELYLGHKASDEIKDEIIKLAKRRNPEIKIFHACLTPDDRLLFLQ